MLSLRSKILLIVTAVIIAAVIAVIVTNTHISSKEYEAALQSRSTAIGKSLAIQFERLLQLGLIIEDITGFEEQCQEVVRAYPGIDQAMVVNATGEVIFSSDAVNPSLHGSLYDAVRNETNGVVTQSLAGVTRHYAIVPAFTPQGDHVASVVVGFPAELITTRLQQMLWTEVGVAVLVLICGLIVLYVALVTFVTRPLGGLIATVTKLRDSPQDMTRRTAVVSQDELGQLGLAFNSLMDELQLTTVSKSELEQALHELQRVSNALFSQKEHLEVTLRSIGDAVISVNSERLIQYINPVAERLTGWNLTSAKDKPLQDILQLVDVANAEPLPDPFLPAFEALTAVSNDVDAELRHRDGAMTAVNYTAALMHGPEGDITGGVLTLRDVSAERRMAQQLSWEASHDPLTGLINRREFTARVEAALTTTKNSGQHHVVCFMDLDRFKIINDTAGHAAGDEFLKMLASSLKAHTRQSDSLARLGGDEFALLLEGCSLEKAQSIATTLLSVVENLRFDWKGRVYTVGISIGMASVNGDVGCAEVLSMADTACYLAKEQGRNRVCIYTADNLDMTKRRCEGDWVTRINAALMEDRFVLYHQTYMDLAAEPDARDHMEILLRMVDENGQLVPPGNFIPAAERYNLMPTVDRWVIKNVFAAYHQLVAQREGRALTCAVNLSGTSLNSTGLFDFIKQQASIHKLPPHAICFEITETAAINNLHNAMELIEACKGLGILFALDDFGTGTSSFGYLKNLPVDYLKIDGGFVRNMGQSDIDRAMTETIHRIGKIMGIRTVAEYAESEGIIDQLREIGVDFAQGYAVSMPSPLMINPTITDHAPH